MEKESPAYIEFELHLNCGGAVSNFEKLNAVTSGVADAKAIIEKAKKSKMLFGKTTYLLYTTLYSSSAPSRWKLLRWNDCR